MKNFLTYSGIKLPLKLVNPLAEEEVGHRNTYYRGYYDSNEKLVRCEKVVYGEVEQKHDYEYYDNDIIKQATISVHGEVQTIKYDERGFPL